MLDTLFPALWQLPASVLALAFVLGTVVGSFLNVCIARLPEQESVVTPRSRCPGCEATIPFYDNIPLLSFALLRGRCRACGVAISWRYPLVELLTGLLFVLVPSVLGLTAFTAAGLLLVSALVAVAFIDLDHQIIPDRISLPGIVVGFVLSAAGCGVDLLDSAIGILLGGGSLWLVAEGYARLRGHEGMGGGDIKLLAMVGAFLGWRAIPVTLMVGSLLGSVIGSLHIALHRGGDSQTPIPFGPFLALGALVSLLYGQRIIDWYFGFAGF